MPHATSVDEYEVVEPSKVMPNPVERQFEDLYRTKLTGAQ